MSLADALTEEVNCRRCQQIIGWEVHPAKNFPFYCIECELCHRGEIMLSTILADISEEVKFAEVDFSDPPLANNEARWHAFHLMMRERTNFVLDVCPDYVGRIEYNTSPSTAAGDQAAFRARMVKIAALAIAAVLATDGTE